jgi:hypothetical protein
MAKVPVVRLIEDAIVVAGTAVTTWQTTGNAAAVVSAVSGAPVLRSAIALFLSGGQSSGLVEATKLLRAAQAVLKAQPIPDAPGQAG